MEDKASNTFREDISREITDFLVGVLRDDDDGGKKETAVKNRMKAAEMLEKRFNILYGSEDDSVIIVDDIPEAETQ